MLRIKIERIVILVLLCLVPLVSADVGVTLTVDWDVFTYPVYTGIVCVGNTDLFGVFDTIIMEYSYNDHLGGVPSPRDLFLQDQGGNVYCANLEPTYWTSDYILDNAKITIKDGGDVIFQDDKWSIDVPVAINDLNHLFHAYERKFNISLKKGWNLISIPLIPLNNSVDYVFRGVNYSGLFSYDLGWKVPTEIKTMLGYWINVNNEYTLTVSGFKPENPLISVRESKNLIGFPYLEEKNISEIFDNVTVRMYNNSKWCSYDSNRQSYLNKFDRFTPGFGYWVYSFEK